MSMTAIFRGLKLITLPALAGLLGTSCASHWGHTADATPGDIRYNSWISCAPDHPETTELRGRVKMRDNKWKLIPDARDNDATVYRTWLHYDEDRLAIDDKLVAGQYRYGRDPLRCQYGQGDVAAVYGGSTGAPTVKRPRWGTVEQDTKH